ncbi:MAG: Malonyl CoA-acyl carrier protein transacylase [Syntrophus sp. SKADARSKE-3]|nr:Malonyl CoA-acyl carrier protein transacylase [Syntrophus sp. SKADARSKE-3]
MEKEVIAAVFPGQGSQRPGMGKDFYDEIAVCRRTYEEASDAAGWDVAAMCFDEDERLNLTEYTQPCILTTEIAMLRGLSAICGFTPSIYGGHSLGEFTALVASGALPLAEAVVIVQNRGRLMQEATPVGMGGMAAVISDGLDVNVMRKAIEDLPLDIANINSANQIVISGASDALPEAEARIMEALPEGKGGRFIRLNVSAPFHSRFMRVIEGPFAATLRERGRGLDAQKAVCVTSNYLGTFHTGDTEDMIGALTSQLGHTVRWSDNMAVIAGASNRIYEIGPGRPLKDFFKSMGVECESVISLTKAKRMFGEKH